MSIGELHGVRVIAGQTTNYLNEPVISWKGGGRLYVGAAEEVVAHFKTAESDRSEIIAQGIYSD